MKTLSIGDVVDRTGVAEGTLRMWERRHGFPVPERLPSGHRRYTEEQVEQIRGVVAARAAGLSLAASIDRARRRREPVTASLYATLRQQRAELEPQTVSKPRLIALSHAIEDECLARADRPILFASFQRERFYRRSEARWRELSAGAECAVVLADFTAVRQPATGPLEVPFGLGHPLAREWSIICDGEHHAVMLAAREPPASSVDEPAAARRFEVVWSVAPETVRAAARQCAAIAQALAPGRIGGLTRLETEAAAPVEDQLRLVTAITNRTLAYLG